MLSVTPTLRPVSYQSPDGKFEKQHNFAAKDDEVENKTFKYAVSGVAKTGAVVVAQAVLVRLVASLTASADVLALASIEVDLSEIRPGTTATVKWRGKPVFIRHRTEAEVTAATADDTASLPDPQSDAERIQRPEWLIVIGVCTHLGCVPISNAGAYHGWFCPCHGSHYDMSGRIRKGPAPLNLEIPEYSFMSDSLVKIG